MSKGKKNVLRLCETRYLLWQKSILLICYNSTMNNNGEVFYGEKY
jgi:hypothetical protein